MWRLRREYERETETETERQTETERGLKGGQLLITSTDKASGLRFLPPLPVTDWL